MTFEQPSKKQKKEAKEYWGEDMYELAGHYRRSISQEERRKKERGEEDEVAKEEPEKAGGVRTIESEQEKGELEKRVSEAIKEKEEELKKKTEDARTLEGEKLSEEGTYDATRNFYLKELGYSVKYDFFHDKAKVLNEKGEYITDKKTKKPIEFKATFKHKGETPILKFLKEEFKEKTKKDLEGKPYEREAKKIESWQEKLEKGAKHLAVLGLTPAAAIEDFTKKIFHKTRLLIEKSKVSELATKLGGFEAALKYIKEEDRGLFEENARQTAEELAKELNEKKKVEEKLKKKSRIWDLIRKFKM